jgi:hypothetical protein
VSVKTLEQKIADLVRRLGSDSEGEILNTVAALRRMLKTNGADLNDLGAAIEKLATGGLEEAALERVDAAGYARGIADARREIAREQAEEEIGLGLLPDGSRDWEAIAVFVQRVKSRLDAKHHRFVDDMASRLAWGREPTDKQGKYLLSLFRQLGGRIT